MDVPQFLQKMQRCAGSAGQLEHLEVLPAREPTFAAPSAPLPETLHDMLARRGIAQLYSHQVASLEAARRGEHVVVVTGTASGKTLCYNLPILERVLSDSSARAMYFFPTKALAQDQLKGLLELVGDDRLLREQVRPGVYDGDTPTAQRRRIRDEANLVLTNPDMLHAGLLPYHPKWATFFSELRYVVIDEIHTYRGILGAHVAAVLRRLDRICRHYGSEPVYLSASATVANPGELASRLIGRDVQLIDQDGSPRGRKYFAMWNPQPAGQDPLSRTSANDEAVRWLTGAVESGGQAIAFTRTRQSAELIHRYAREQLLAQHSPLADKVRAYRGGYLPNERRQMEQDLFAGELRGVVATNALELGIDIGSLDVAVLVGYPGTIASCWQQAGRSGRRHGDSLAVLIAGNEPIDHYLQRHPEYFFAQTPEHAVVDPNNPHVLARHLAAAAFELPLDRDDLELFGPLAPAVTQILASEQKLAEIDGQYFSPGGQSPAIGVSLRHMSDNTFSIVEVSSRRLPRHALVAGEVPLSQLGHEVIANVDSISAPELVYPEAIYLHNSETFLVRDLDLNGKVAYVERRETDYYTQAVLESSVITSSERLMSDAIAQAHIGFGDVEVSWQTVAFKKIKFQTRENIGMGPVDIPAQQLATTGMWLRPDNGLRAQLKQQGLKPSEGICGLRNLAVMSLPLVAMCDSRDIGGVVDSKNFGQSSIILYDRYPGGLGYCLKGFEHLPRLLEICWDMVQGCPCDEGCPSCVGLPNLRPAIHSDPDLLRGNPLPDKLATLRLLELLLDLPAEASSASRSAMVEGKA